MPKHVRNFWVSARVDGKQTRVAFGPVKKDGGFDMTIQIRDRGEPLTVAEVIGSVGDDGKLKLRINEFNGTKVLKSSFVVATDR